MNIKTKIFLCAAFFCPVSSFAFAPPGDKDYLILEEDSYRVIFDRRYLESIDTINRKIKSHLENMSSFKNRTLDERLTIILLSSKTQISNALATVLPSFTIVLYPVGIVGLHELSLPIWFEGVFEHELNHIFQMSHSKSPKILRKIFNMPGLLFFYLYNPYPNLSIPSFILEGDSVLKESLFHYGGRLYNGYGRALVYSQIKHYQHQKDQFMNQNLLGFRLNPHSGKEKYLHGGYFMAMLAEKYSHETINSFFKVNKKKPSKKIQKQIKEAPVKEFFSPLFGEKFSFQNIPSFLKNLTKSYFNRWLKEAALQKSSHEPVLFESAACPAFGSSGEEVFFLTSDFKSLPSLRIFNKKTKEWTSKKSDLPVGKIFKIKGKYYARSRQTVEPHIIHYSLFSEGLKNNKQFDSKYVQDLWKDKTLYIDPKNNLNGFNLYVNGSLYSETHSNALFDENGNIYFFKQERERRTLYKNKKPVFSYSGYYGSVLDVSGAAIYFTGASPYGSSLYQYKNGKVSRSASSDTIIQAKAVNNKEFIVCEVTPYGYEYKIIPKKLSREKPVLYQYQFKKRKQGKAAQALLRSPPVNSLASNHPPAAPQKAAVSQEGLIPQAAVSQGAAASKERLKTEVKRQISAAGRKNETAHLKSEKYSPLKHIRYKGGNFQGIFGGAFSIFGTSFLFSDYLLHHSITPGYLTIFPDYHLEKGLHLLSLVYQNRIYPLEWTLGYQLNLESELASSGSSSSRASSLGLGHTGYTMLNYPVFKKGRWFSSMSSLKSIEALKEPSEDFRIKSLFRGWVNLGYSRSFPYNYAPERSSVVSVFVDNRYDFNKNANGFKLGGIWDSIQHLGSEWYIFPSVSYARSFKPRVNPVQVSLYKSAGFKDADYENLSAFFHSSDPPVKSFEDLDYKSFVTGDIYEPLFKAGYKAKSIGAASIGLKKAIDISLGGWESRLAPLMRVRWLVLEDLLAVDKEWDRASRGIVSFEDQRPNKDISTENVEKLVGLSEKEEEKKVKKTKRYTQWLEWSFGFESEFIILNGNRLILGFSFGRRTPVKFWKKKSDLSTEGNSAAGRAGFTYGDSGKSAEKFPQSAFANIYLKAPL